MPHLEHEEVFGSSKWKLDLSIELDGDSHHPDNFNFLQPRVLIRSTRDYIEPMKETNTIDNSGHVPHVTTTFEMDCDTTQWHIARILYKSSYKCHVQHRRTNICCIARIAKGSKGTPAPTYHGHKKQYGGNKEIMTDF